MEMERNVPGIGEEKDTLKHLQAIERSSDQEERENERGFEESGEESFLIAGVNYPV